MKNDMAPGDLIARMQCSALIADYAYYVDHRQFDEAVSLFVEDGTIERPDLVSRGHDEIAANWSRRPTSVVTCHVCSPPSFREIGPGEASATTYFTLYHVHHEEGGPPPLDDAVAIGEFHDQFVLTSSGWRFWRRKVTAALKRA